MARFGFLRSWWFRRAAAIFLIALALRLLFFWAMMSQISTEQLTTLDRDSQAYLESAHQIQDHFNYQSYGVLLFGPGYPTMLALWLWMSQGNVLLLVVRQIFMSSLVACLIMWWAYKLIKDRRIAFVAGLLNAVSLIAITMANIFFAETVFMAFMLIGLIAFLHALQTNRKIFFLLAGIALSLALLMRSAGQYLFVVLLIMTLAVCVQLPLRRFVHMLLWSLLPVIMMMVVTWAWIAHNERVYDIKYLALSAPGGMAHLVRAVNAEKYHLDWNASYIRFTKGVKELEGKPTDSIDITKYRPYYPFESVTDSNALSFNRAFALYAGRSLQELLKSDPWLTLKTYTYTVWLNVTTDWGKHYGYLPAWDQFFRRLTSGMDKRGLNYRGILLSLIGAVMLWRRGMRRELVILVSLYCYFAALTGFSVFQGTRVFYPGQVAWLILAAYPLVALFDLLKRVRKTKAKEALKPVSAPTA